MSKITKVLVATLALLAFVVSLNTQMTLNINNSTHNTIQPAPEHIINCKTVQNNKECVIVMNNKINGIKESSNILILLETAKSGDKITFMIAGVGGEIFTLEAIVDSINNTKADVTTKVVGNVYSAHAVLGLAGKHIILKPSAVIMFHHSSALRDRLKGNDVCLNVPVGDERESCTLYINNHLAEFEAFMQVQVYKYLTAAEIKKIQEGGEVFLKGAELTKRINK